MPTRHAPETGPPRQPATPTRTGDPKPIDLTGTARIATLEALPVAVLVLDEHAVIRYCNRRTAELLGITETAIVGRSVLEFVPFADLDFVVELVEAGRSYSGHVMGPSRVRYVDAAGQSHWTHVWSSATPPELGIDGFLVTLTMESVRDVLATAVGPVAGDDELDATLLAIAGSAQARPLGGHGVMLVVEPDADDGSLRFRCVGDWPLEPTSIDAPDAPWHLAVHTSQDADVDHATDPDLPPWLRAQFIDAGSDAAFVRVVRCPRGEVNGVCVVFRNAVGTASANQNDHLNDIVRHASLAFVQAHRLVELEAAAHRDALTGAANRAAFMERLHTERRELDAFFVDLDHFKSVNDTFGHEAGDAVVTEAAARIAKTVRTGDVVYRIGGDEFVIVCGVQTDEAERAAIAHRIIERLTEPFDFVDQPVRIGATVGIACGRGRNLAATVKAADAAMYVAKASGRGGWEHAPPAT